MHVQLVVQEQTLWLLLGLIQVVIQVKDGGCVQFSLSLELGSRTGELLPEKQARGG